MCDKCKEKYEKLKEALFTIVGERDLEALQGMKEFLETVSDQSEGANAAFFAIKTLVEILEEEQNETTDGLCK